jgi:hypothetical protein
MPGPLKWFPPFRPPDQNVVWLYSFLDLDFKLFCEVPRKPVRHIAMKRKKPDRNLKTMLYFFLLSRFTDVGIVFTAIAHTKRSKVVKIDRVFFEKIIDLFEIYRRACFNLRFRTDSAAANFWRCQSCLTNT